MTGFLIPPGSDIFVYLIDYVVEVHRIHHRATLSLRASKSGENFGIGQNTGETLPNFRQKSKGILKIN
ncbi:pyrimidine 2 [Prunus dulcis]|uniref:Pyrimidine 2 n=1 Tax=Prunus dulcis TaxID=3755 RepID=A0A4Y1QXV5_PRUDU|nr:pyrimidine 2 [Prunus dulcis]